MVWKMLFEEFQDGCLVYGHFLICEWDDFSYPESQCCLTHPIKFQLETIYGLEDVVLRISRCLFSSDI